MNIDKKLELAHEYLLRWSGVTVKDAWQYADAMEAEYNKRKTTGLPEALRPPKIKGPDLA